MEIRKLSRNELVLNLILYFIGVSIMPLGVVLTINAHLGAGGYDALNFALGEMLHIKTSYAIDLTASLVLIITALIRKGFPRVTTFIASFFLGIFTDVWKGILAGIQGTNLVSSLIILGVGIIVVAFAVAAYMISVFPSNPTDDFVVALSEKGWKIWKAKMMLDVICVVIAWVLGGEIGLGTIVCTFCIGYVVDFFHGLMSRQVEIINKKYCSH